MSSEKKDSRKNQAPTLIQCIEKEGKTVADIANALGVASTQVYKWNREGIKETCKHYNNLKSIIPSLQPAEERITAKGKPDGRSNSGVKRKLWFYLKQTYLLLKKSHLKAHYSLKSSSKRNSRRFCAF